MSGKRNWWISLVVLTTFVLLSCPLAIDQDLLLIVEDDYVPEITVAAPHSNTLYTNKIPIDGFVRDFSGQDGDREGALNTLSFTVAGASRLQLDVTFTDTVSENVANVSELDMHIDFTPSSGSWSDTVWPALSTGDCDISVDARDPAGNQGSDTGNLTIS